MIKDLITNPLAPAALALFLAAVLWPRKRYRCDCHGVKVGTARDRRLHGNARRILR